MLSDLFDLLTFFDFFDSIHLMHELITILRRFIPPYKIRVTKSILFNFLHALFGSLSIAMLIPILKIIFQNENDITEPVPFALDSQTLNHLFNYYITTIKYSYGQSTTLIVVGLIAVIATAFKTGFAYLANLQIRNLPT